MSFLRRHWFLLVLVHIFMLQAPSIAMRIGMTYEGVRLGLGPFWIGAIGGVFGLLPALFALNIGRHIDRVGERSALVWGSAISLVAAAGLILVEPTFLVLLGASLLMGFGQFMAIAGQQSSAAIAAGRGSVQSFGWMTMSVALAQTVGPLIVGFYSAGELVPETGGIFLMGMAAGLACLLCALLIHPPHHRAAASPQGIWANARQIFGTAGFVLATSVSLVIFSAMELLVIFLPIYGAEQAIDAATIGLLLSIRGGASMISRLFFGPLLRLLGKKTFIILSLALSGLAIGGLVLSANLVVMGILLFIAGIGLGVGAPLSLSWLAEIVPGEIRGSAYAVRLSMNRFGQFLLPVAAGPVAGAAGIGSVFVGISASLLFGAAFVMRRFRPGG